MNAYRTPIEEIRFALSVARSVPPFASSPIAEYPEYADVLDAGARLAESAFAPLNASGNFEGSRLEAGQVRTPAGYRQAYAVFAEGGWSGLGLPKRLGGQGIPFPVAIAISEIFNSANLALAMGLMPLPGVVALIDRFGTPRQKQYYIPPLVSGDWTATMALTEPQAGSDLGAITSRATPDGTGNFLIRGRKSLITWGDHDLSGNILHLVLARSPNGPPGSRGLSLYLVAKRNPDGHPNDVACIGLEDKIGLSASPTASLIFGENGGAAGERLGEENAGLEQLFVLLNQARLRVAGFALGSAERARQAALSYAQTRVQGRDDSGNSVTIDKHPDVQRMLTSMEASTEAMRLLIQYVAELTDAAAGSDDASGVAADLLEILTPVVKGWSTETGFSVASTGVQIFGGMGYSRECEAAQYFCEARVNMIYEGTTGIQANDLIFRKLRKNSGKTVEKFFQLIAETLESSALEADECNAMGRQIEAKLALLRTISNSIVEETGDMNRTRGNAAHYLVFFGALVASWLSWSAACRARSAQAQFSARKTRNAWFMVEQCLAPAAAVAESTLLHRSGISGGGV